MPISECLSCVALLVTTVLSFIIMFIGMVIQNSLLTYIGLGIGMILMIVPIIWIYCHDVAYAHGDIDAENVAVVP